MTKFDYGVFIGRFQPMHLGHKHVIDEALAQVETLIILIGSTDVARNPVNPFTFEERFDLIAKTYRHEIAEGRLVIGGVEDQAEDDDAWCDEVRETVQELILIHLNPNPNATLHGYEGRTIALAGYGKDKSSFYLDHFPEWASIQIETQHGTLSSTDIRQQYFQSLPRWPTKLIPEAVEHFLTDFMWTSEFKELVAETAYYALYPTLWGKGPFLTADTAVFHPTEEELQVLLVTRGKTPGKGLLAFPGGFLNTNETFEQGALRELREETGLDLPPTAIFHAFLADNPKRSLRGRVVSVVHMIELAEKPEVIGSDDAAHAAFYDVDALTPSMFFEDHFQILVNALSNLQEA